MTDEQWMKASRRLASLLLRIYPADFRDEMGEGVVETYLDRCRSAVRYGGVVALGRVWLLALADSLRNGLAERVRPAVSWSCATDARSSRRAAACGCRFPSPA